MKNNLRMMTVIVALGVVFGCAVTSFAQMDEPIVGGYSAVDAAAVEVVAAAKHAVKTQAKKQRSKIKLVAVKKAEQQVVAGMNYNLCLQVTVIEKGRKTAVPQTIQTVVFLNLKQKFELTSWAIAACAEEKPPEILIK